MLPAAVSMDRSPGRPALIEGTACSLVEECRGGVADASHEPGLEQFSTGDDDSAFDDGKNGNLRQAPH